LTEPTPFKALNSFLIEATQPILQIIPSTLAENFISGSLDSTVEFLAVLLSDEAKFEASLEQEKIRKANMAMYLMFFFQN
jgi:hypothetical protein